MGALEDRFYTVEEYFSILEQSDEKLEYHNGKIYVMAGGTSNHNAISVNVSTQLKIALSGKGCQVYSSDQQVMIESINRYVYPDFSVACGDREFADEKKTKLLNPILVVEVLSASTAVYDKNTKLSLYSKIPSFKEYILVNAERVEVHTYYKEDDELWRISFASNLEDKIKIYSLGVEISVAEIYDEINDIEKGI